MAGRQRSGSRARRLRGGQLVGVGLAGEIVMLGCGDA